jgi:hypothetical protein
MPDLAPPVAAPPAAPAAAAPSAPAPAASTPAAPVAPAPSSAPAITPAESTTATPSVAAPAAPAAPAKFNPATSATPPKKEDYPQTQDGFDAHGEDLGAWVFHHPEEAARLKAERLGDSAPVAETDPVAEAAAKAEGEEKPAEVKPEPVTAPTPAKIEEWTTKNAKLKEAFTEDPTLQAEIMQMARDNESAKGVLEVVSTKEEAQFAVERANRLVSLQANWMLAAEDPEMVETAWGQLEDMFKSRDDKGQEIKDATGKVQFDSDFQPFVSKAANVSIQGHLAGFQATIDALTQRLAGNYPNEEAKAADADALEKATYAKAALDFATEIINGGDGPKLPALPPNATPEQIEFQKKLERQQADLDAKLGKQTVESRKAARLALDNKIGRAWSAEVGTKIEAHIAAMKERGEYLPEFVLSDKWVNPQTQQVTNSTAFGVYCWNQLHGKIFGWIDPQTKQIVGGNPTEVATLARLQAMGAGAEAARQKELTRLTNKYLPKILDDRVKQIQNDLRNGGKKPAAAPAGAPVARVEPSTQAVVMPQSMGDGDLRKWAQAEAAKRPDWAASSPKEREELVGEIFNNKKFFGQ